LAKEVTLLIAEYNFNRISADIVLEGPEYLCPQCKKIVTLKRGRIVVAHFSMVWSATNALAIELQHTSIGIPEIEARAHAYSRAGIAQIWLPFLSRSVLSASDPRADGTLFIEKYSPRPFEKWVHGFGGGDGMWMYVPDEKAFRHAKMKGHQTYVESSSWFGEGGEEMSAG
jgi:competence protein CoiA